MYVKSYRVYVTVGPRIQRAPLTTLVSVAMCLLPLEPHEVQTTAPSYQPLIHCVSPWIVMQFDASIEVGKSSRFIARQELSNLTV